MLTKLRVNRKQIRCQVFDQVWDHVNNQVGFKAYHQVRSKVWREVGDTVWPRVYWPVRMQVLGQTKEYISYAY